MTLEEQLISVNHSIELLQKNKIEIEDQLMAQAKTFKERLKAWHGASNRVDEPWILDKTEYPKLRKYINQLELNRYSYYSIDDMFEDDIHMLLNPENLAEYEYFRASPEVIECLEEAIEKKLASFHYDW